MDEQVLVDVLCRVREVWWPNVSKMNREYYGYYFGEYGKYVQQYWQDDKLNKEMDENFLRKVSEWRMLSLEEILDELRSYPLFNKLLTRYWSIAKAYLCDIDSRYKELTEVNPQHIADATGSVCIYSPCLGKRFEKQFFFLGERGTTDKVLLERMLAIQKVRGMLKWRPDSKAMEGSQTKARAVKQTAIQFIKEELETNSEYRPIIDTKQGGNAKDLRRKLYPAFMEKYPSKRNVKVETFDSYITDALNELYPNRKRID